MTHAMAHLDIEPAVDVVRGRTQWTQWVRWYAGSRADFLATPLDIPASARAHVAGKFGPEEGRPFFVEVVTSCLRCRSAGKVGCPGCGGSCGDDMVGFDVPQTQNAPPWWRSAVAKWKTTKEEER